MAEYNNNMKGVLYKNDKKTEDKHPNYKGSCEIEGRQYWLAGWMKKNDDGTFKLLSLSFTAKEEQPSATTATEPSDNVPDEDLPF